MGLTLFGNSVNAHDSDFSHENQRETEPVASSKRDIGLSFHALAQNTRLLLDHLGIDRTAVVAHSMGGMFAVRFALMFPEKVEKLILESPIGLEDYRLKVPTPPVTNWCARPRR